MPDAEFSALMGDIVIILPPRTNAGHANFGRSDGMACAEARPGGGSRQRERVPNPNARTEGRVGEILTPGSKTSVGRRD